MNAAQERAAKARLAALAQQSAADPMAAARNANETAQLVAALHPVSNEHATRIPFRVPGFAAIATTKDATQALRFGAPGYIRGVRGCLLGVALTDIVMTQVGFNFNWGTGSGQEFVRNGQGSDTIKFAVLFGQALGSPSIWYPVNLRIPASNTDINVYVYNGSGGNVTPDLYFDFEPDQGFLGI